MWGYKRTNKSFNGIRVYKKYCFGEFAGYCYKQRLKQLRKGKEYNIGFEYPSFDRTFRDDNNNYFSISWDELSKQFETGNKKQKKAT
ncbi:hypothetical protein [Aquibacillus saliphilus]|uniref:hypothetical protein n=1 Tax=Aquibacillus saliphilus TaxID=1909422 RepID=UPI001CF000C6|nr:hypothetical protein [Aquibacillus saliphilus]